MLEIFCNVVQTVSQPWSKLNIDFLPPRTVHMFSVAGGLSAARPSVCCISHIQRLHCRLQTADCSGLQEVTIRNLLHTMGLQVVSLSDDYISELEITTSFLQVVYTSSQQMFHLPSNGSNRQSSHLFLVTSSNANF